MADAEQPDYTIMAVQLLTAYVSHTSVPIDQLPGLIENRRTVLAKRDDVPAAPEAPAEDFTPAVPARKSPASREHIVSMIGVKPCRTLKRHLSTHGLTPANHRARYGLAADYPMVAPACSEARRETAKRLGFGRKPAAPQVDATGKPRRGRRPASGEAAAG